MKVLFVFLLGAFLFLPTLSHSVVTIKPNSQTSVSPLVYQKIASLRLKDLQKLKGRKLTIKEKISFFILKHIAKKHAKEGKGGQTALGFGIAAAALFVLGLFVPYLILGALIAAILAVVLGSVAKRQDPSDKKAFAATLLGWITLGAIALILLLAVVIVASWGWL
jgi:hypothetical protein